MLQASALTGQGVREFWERVDRFRAQQTASGRLRARRHQQDEAWMWERIEAGLKVRFREHPKVHAALDATRTEVIAGRLAASVAARRLLDLME